MPELIYPPSQGSMNVATVLLCSILLGTNLLVRFGPVTSSPVICCLILVVYNIQPEYLSNRVRTAPCRAGDTWRKRKGNLHSFSAFYQSTCLFLSKQPFVFCYMYKPILYIGKQLDINYPEKGLFSKLKLIFCRKLVYRWTHRVVVFIHEGCNKKATCNDVTNSIAEKF